jgi:hypothetical protein
VLKQQCADFYETFRQTATARAAALLLPTWLSHAELTASQVDSACAAVASAGTWDEIVLHGGASHTGDFICIDGFRLQAAGYGRRDVGEITCAHTRSSFLGTSYAVLGWEPSVHVQAWARRRSATANLNGTPAGPAAAAGGGDDAASESTAAAAAAAVAAAASGVASAVGDVAASWLAPALGGVGAAVAGSGGSTALLHSTALASAQLPITSSVRFRPAGSAVDVAFSLNEVESIMLSVPLSRPQTGGGGGAAAAAARNHRNNDRRRSRSSSGGGGRSSRSISSPSRSPGPPSTAARARGVGATAATATATAAAGGGGGGGGAGGAGGAGGGGGSGGDASTWVFVE